MSEGLQLKNLKKYLGMYRALVLDNNDPDKLGRIKAKVYPMFSNLTADLIPWAVPAMPLFEGAGTNIGSFYVPDIGSYVFVFFEAGDIYQPVYFAEAQTAQKGLPGFRATNYPHRKGWRTSSGIEFYVDDSDKKLRVNHPSGSYIEIDENGKITVYGKSDIVIKSDTLVSINP